MKNTLLNISGKIDDNTVQLYKAVATLSNELNIPFVVIGASARDIVLHHGYGARIQRATMDVDFGVQVPGWGAFAQLKECLVKQGFSQATQQHRLISPDGIPVDVIPFGQMEDDRNNIQWPPDGAVVMSVLGFQEACDHAQTVRIQNDPAVDIPVATPEGMALLKLVAWLDRSRDKRKGDARDLAYLFTTYEEIPAVHDVVYANQQLMEEYDWDVTLAIALQLGKASSAISSEATSEYIQKLLSGNHETHSTEQLVEEMCDIPEQQFDRNEALLDAFTKGFTI